MTSKNYSVIISQAKEDFFCFGDMENEFKDGLTGIHILKQNAQISSVGEEDTPISHNSCQLSINNFT